MKFRDQYLLGNWRARGDTYERSSTHERQWPLLLQPSRMGTNDSPPLPGTAGRLSVRDTSVFLYLQRPVQVRALREHGERQTTEGSGLGSQPLSRKGPTHLLVLGFVQVIVP